MNTKNPLIIIGISLAVVIALGFFMFIYPWLALWFGLATMPNPPKPTILYGEFPCQLTYELNGEIKIISDVVICEFDGYGQRTEAGQYRKWKMYLKSTGKDMITLYDLRTNNDYTDWGNQVLELCFDPGNAEYYMGDIGDDRQRQGSMGKWIDYLYLSSDGKTGYSVFKTDEAWDKYKIKLISWEPSPPIQNSFK